MIIDPNDIIDPLLAEKGLVPGAVVQARQHVRLYSANHDQRAISGVRFEQWHAKKKEQLVYCGYSTAVRSELPPETICPYGITFEACLVFLPVGQLAKRINGYNDKGQSRQLYCQPAMKHNGMRYKLHNIITPYMFTGKLTHFGQYDDIVSEAQRDAMRNVFINEVINCLFYVQKDCAGIR